MNKYLVKLSAIPTTDDITLTAIMTYTAYSSTPTEALDQTLVCYEEDYGIKVSQNARKKLSPIYVEDLILNDRYQTGWAFKGSVEIEVYPHVTKRKYVNIYAEIVEVHVPLFA